MKRLSRPQDYIPRHRQTGLGLISVLVALLVFSLGILGLAALYAQVVPVGAQNRFAMNAANAGQAFWAVGNANPQQVPNLNFTTLSSAPGVLATWVQQLQASFPPGVNATATTAPDPLGNPCSAQSCSVTLTITWPQFGVTRTQTFHEQFGF